MPVLVGIRTRRPRVIPVSGGAGVSPIPPVAGFSGTPRFGTAPLSVQFTDASTGSPTAWAWTFGDGGTSAAQNPLHTYTVPGSYTVTLTVSNSAGGNSVGHPHYVTVIVPTPAEVTFVVPALTRSFTVPAITRVFIVPNP